jgi:uncharacterized membrane protein
MHSATLIMGTFRAVTSLNRSMPCCFFHELTHDFIALLVLILSFDIVIAPFGHYGSDMKIGAAHSCVEQALQSPVSVFARCSSVAAVSLRAYLVSPEA